MSNFYSFSREALGILAVALFCFAASPAWAQTFTADLSGANEVPPVDTEASGSVEAVLDGLSLTVSGSFEGLESDYNAAVGSHIHRAAVDANGPVIFPLNPTLDGDNRGGTFEPGNNTFTLTQAQADDLAAGLYYVNVHSVDNGSGEVRGQLVEPAGGARLQVIHNATDPAAAVVDVYVEEVSTDEPFIEDFAFRTATPYVTVPAGVALTVTVAPGNSNNADDGLASFEYTLEEGETYQLIANGVLDPSQFEANPSGEPIALTFFVNGAGREASDDDGQVQFNVVHGSTDAPAVDVIARDVATLVDGATYGDLTDYIGVPEGRYLLDVTPDEANDVIVATFEADLRGAAGAALTVLASGFLSPDNDQNDEAFGLLAVFADGTTALLPTGPVSNEGGAVSPTAFTLRGAYPNPVQAAATVQFDLGTDARVSVEVFDVLGRRVLQTAPASMGAGTAQEVRLDAGALPSGAYLYRLTAETAAETLVQNGRLTVIR